MEIYVVTTGDYSDYSIQAIFDSEEKANEYIEGMRSLMSYSSFNDIETYTLNKSFDFKDVRSKTAFEIVIDIERKVEVDDDVLDFEIDYALNNQVFYLSGSRLNNRDGYKFYLFAETKEAAIKIANDKLSQIIATVGWGKLID